MEGENSRHELAHDIALFALASLVLLFIGCADVPTAETPEIQGIVQKENGTPVPGAWVDLIQHPAPSLEGLIVPRSWGTLGTVRTDSRGRFTIRPPAGSLERLALFVWGKSKVGPLADGQKSMVITDIEQESVSFTALNVIKTPSDFIPAAKVHQGYVDMTEFR
jgi:hypothetical protein